MQTESNMLPKNSKKTSAEFNQMNLQVPKVIAKKESLSTATLSKQVKTVKDRSKMVLFMLLGLPNSVTYY